MRVMRAIFAVLGIPVLFFILMTLGMALGYVGGSVFDYFMGTNLLPIFVLGGLVGIGVDFQKTDGDQGFGAQMGYAVVMAITWPFMALLGAVVANWFFPETTKNFIAMVGYKTGGIYSLAFWGSVTGGLVKLVVSVPMRFIANMMKW